MTTDPRIEAAALEDAADVIWMRANAEPGVCAQDRETDSYAVADEVAREVISAYLTAADKAAELTTEQEVDALPIGSVILVRGRSFQRYEPRVHGGFEYHAWMCADGGFVREEGMIREGDMIAGGIEVALLPARVIHYGGTK